MGAVIDPLTGKLSRGNVSSGRLRVRQDFLIADSLLAPTKRQDRCPRRGCK